MVLNQGLLNLSLTSLWALSFGPWPIGFGLWDMAQGYKVVSWEELYGSGTRVYQIYERNACLVSKGTKSWRSLPTWLGRHCFYLLPQPSRPHFEDKARCLLDGLLIDTPISNCEHSWHFFNRCRNQSDHISRVEAGWLRDDLLIGATRSNYLHIWYFSTFCRKPERTPAHAWRQVLALWTPDLYTETNQRL